MPPLGLEGSGAPLLKEEEPVQTGKYRKSKEVASPWGLRLKGKMKPLHYGTWMGCTRV